MLWFRDFRTVFFLTSESGVLRTKEEVTIADVKISLYLCTSGPKDLYESLRP